MRIQIRTLGSLEIRSDLQELAGFLDQPVRTALLLHLAVEKEVTREDVMALLWPDHDPERARHTLSQTLYLLRKELGQEWLETKGDRLRTTPAISVDVHSFRAAVERGDHPTAVEEYGGPFLAGWRFPGTGQFEGWVDGIRIKLSRQFREANRDHVAELRDAGDLSRAVTVAMGWADADPLDDEAQHCLLELLLETGDRVEALRRFESYEQLLSVDGLTPLDHTLSMMASVRGGDAPSGAGEIERPGGGGDASPMAERGGAGGLAGGKPGPDPRLGPEPRSAKGPPVPMRWRWGWKTAIAAAFGALILSSWALWASRPDRAGVSLIENKVLVVPLENQTGDDGKDDVGRMAADWITQGLSSAGFLEVVPSMEIMPVFTPREGGVEPDPLANALEWAREMGAATVVYGTYYQRGEGLEFHVQAASVANRELLQVIGPVSSPSEDPMPAVDVLRQRAMIALAVHFDESLGGLLQEATLPPSYESYLAFLEGFELFGLGRRAEAIPHLERSTELSPEFKAPLILAGFAHSGLGNYQAAESLAAVVRISVESLTPYDRLRLDFLEASVKGDREGSLRATQAAAALQPGGTAHYAAGSQALSLNRPRLALEILSTFDLDGLAGRVYPPLWNAITTAHHSLGEYGEELEKARQGRRTQPYSLAILFYEIRALAALGMVDQVAERLEECINFPPAQRGWTPPEVMLSAAEELRVHGHFEASSRAVDRALQWFDSRPAEEQLSEEHRRGLGWALSMAERWEEAQTVFQELETASPFRIDYLGNLGVLAARLGDEDEARALDLRLAGLEGPYRFGSHTLWRARIAAQLGDLEVSLGHLRDALGEGAAFPFDILHREADFDPLREQPAFLDILRPKG